MDEEPPIWQQMRRPKFAEKFREEVKHDLRERRAKWERQDRENANGYAIIFLLTIIIYVLAQIF